MPVSYAEALSHIEHVASQLRSVLLSTPVTQDLDSSLGSTSSEDVYGQKTLPPLDNSAMDGYAVSSIDTVNASAETPVRLEILGSIAAGDHPPTFDFHTSSETCFIINTGAPFPLPSSSTCLEGSQNEGTRFDACLRKEDAHPSKCGKYVDLIKPVKTMQHRRKAGEDYKPGTKLLSSGDIITPERIAALSSHGFSHLKTIRQPRIAVLSTGKELEQVSSLNERNGESSIKTPPSHIYDSNSHYILAALKTWGYEDVTRLTSLGDNPEEFEKTIHTASERRYDVLISTGGVSKGQHDYIEG